MKVTRKMKLICMFTSLVLILQTSYSYSASKCTTVLSNEKKIEILSKFDLARLNTLVQNSPNPDEDQPLLYDGKVKVENLIGTLRQSL